MGVGKYLSTAVNQHPILTYVSATGIVAAATFAGSRVLGRSFRASLATHPTPSGEGFLDDAFEAEEMPLTERKHLLYGEIDWDAGDTHLADVTRQYTE